MRFKNIKKRINSEKIEAAIADFESNLNFEFVPVIAQKSSYVEHIGWIISLLILILFIASVDLIFNYYLHDSWISPLPFYLLSPFASYLLGNWIDKSDFVDRFFISKNERIRQVQEKAELFFFKNQLHEVESHNVLLLYISVMERQIVLYHDHRITFDKMSSLDHELLKTLQASFKDNNYELGLLHCIQTLKQNLGSQFPRTKINSTHNLVPNKLLWLDENDLNISAKL